MFGIIADYLAILTTILFPIFASYKAIRTSDPAQLKPWLMYWVVLTILLQVEEHVYFILGWVPFYSWLRLLLHLYLIMPGPSVGATQLYTTHIHPFLEHHEADLDKLIASSHDRAKAAGLQYLKKAIEYVRVQVLGLPPSRPTPPASRHASYAQQLISRFNLPASTGSGTGAADFYNLVAHALAGATTGTPSSPRDAGDAADDLAASGTLVPPELRGAEDRMAYVATQRERLRVLLQAFDREAYNLANDSPGRPSQGRLSPELTKSRSEVEFERVEVDEYSSGDELRKGGTPPLGGGWMPWNWGAGKEAGGGTGLSPADRPEGAQRRKSGRSGEGAVAAEKEAGEPEAEVGKASGADHMAY